MRRMSYQQFAIVQGDSAQQLTERLNQKLYELRDKQPTVTFEGLIARISYMEEDIVETENLYKTGGLKLKCKDCPNFEPILKKDGTADRRMAYGRCPLAVDGWTGTESEACEKLTEWIKDREVKICFREE